MKRRRPCTAYANAKAIAAESTNKDGITNVGADSSTQRQRQRVTVQWSRMPTETQAKTQKQHAPATVDAAARVDVATVQLQHILRTKLVYHMAHYNHLKGGGGGGGGSPSQNEPGQNLKLKANGKTKGKAKLSKEKENVDDLQLLRGLEGQTKELYGLLERTVTMSENHTVLLVGPRGVGKTMCMRRVFDPLHRRFGHVVHSGQTQDHSVDHHGKDSSSASSESRRLCFIEI